MYIIDMCVYMSICILMLCMYAYMHTRTYGCAHTRVCMYMHLYIHMGPHACQSEDEACFEELRLNIITLDIIILLRPRHCRSMFTTAVAG